MEALGLSNEETYFFNFLGSNINLDNIREGVVYTDIFLKSVKAECGAILIEQLDLDYETLDDSEVLNKANKMLLLSDTTVKSKDALYNYKTVYHQGMDNNPPFGYGIDYDPSTLNGGFSGWKRYRHAMHPDSQLFGLEDMPSKSDPYLRIGLPGCNTSYDQQSISIEDASSGIKFDHSFLESGIQQTSYSPDYIAGETYEVRTLIFRDANGSDKMCNFDINIVGAYSDFDAPLPSCGTVSYNTGTNSYLTNRQTTIFSTFNRALKWNTRAGINPFSQYLYTSNYFTLPNLPNSYSGFYVQVGPANSDHIFNMNPETTNILQCDGDGGNTIGVINNRAYINGANGNGILFGYKRETQPIPANFGMGLPWYLSLIHI